MPDESIAITPEDKPDLNPGPTGGLEISDDDLNEMYEERGSDDDEKEETGRDEKGKFKKAESADEDEGDDDPEIDLPGVGKHKASDIKKWRETHERSEQIEARASELEEQLQDASTQGEKLKALTKIDALMAKYPKVRDRMNEVLKEFAESGDFGDEDDSPSRSGFDTKRFREETKEEDPEEVADREWIRNQRRSEAGGQIRDFLLKSHGEYPDFIPVEKDGDGNVVGPDKTWLKDVFAKEVRDRFGEDIDMSHIRMTLNDMIVTKGVIKKARENGRADATEALARLPKGSVVIPAGGSKKQTVPPEKNWRNESYREIERSFAEDDSIFQKRSR